MDKVEKVASLLHEAGYLAKIDENRHVVFSGMNGLKFGIGVDDDAVQFLCSVSVDHPNSSDDLRLVNEINESYKFVKVFVANDGSFVVVNDHFFDHTTKDASERFARFLELFEISTLALKDLFSKRDQKIHATIEGQAGENGPEKKRPVRKKPVPKRRQALARSK